MADFEAWARKYRAMEVFVREVEAALARLAEGLGTIEVSVTLKPEPPEAAANGNSAQDPPAAKPKTKRRQFHRARSGQVIIDGKKLCTGCDRRRAVKHFGVNRTAKTGLQSYCRDCKPSRKAPSAEPEQPPLLPAEGTDAGVA